MHNFQQTFVIVLFSTVYAPYGRGGETGVRVEEGIVHARKLFDLFGNLKYKV